MHPRPYAGRTKSKAKSDSGVVWMSISGNGTVSVPSCPHSDRGNSWVTSQCSVAINRRPG